MAEETPGEMTARQHRWLMEHSPEYREAWDHPSQEDSGVTYVIDEDGPDPVREAIERAGIPPHLRPGRKEMTDEKVLFWVEPQKEEDG